MLIKGGVTWIVDMFGSNKVRSVTGGARDLYLRRRVARVKARSLYEKIKVRVCGFTARELE